MQKYVFDLVGQDRSQYDYRGRVLAAPEKAFRLAELIALDLDIRGGGEWSGWSINVHNEQGQQYFSVPVPSPS